LFSIILDTKEIQAQATPADTLKVITFNLYGKPLSQWDTRLGMILNELEINQPDIIGVQEVVEPFASNTARELADSLRLRTGLPYKYIYINTHFSWDTYNEGIGIITPHLIIEQDVGDLPEGVFQRKVIYARVLTPTGIINLFNTHLSYGNQQPIRDDQVAAIKAFIAEKSSDKIAALNLLCGDFNSGPEAYSIQMLTDPASGSASLDSWVVQNPGNPGYTMPSDLPSDRIDYIFLRDGDYGQILASRQILNTPNKENLYPSDHFGVLSQFGSTTQKVTVQIDSPDTNQEVNGIFPISWSVEDSLQKLTATIYLTSDAGSSWSKLWQGPVESGSFNWSTSQYADGTKYKIKILVTADSAFGLVETGFFTVNNPGNAKPEVEVIAPRHDSAVDGSFQIQWLAADPDGDVLDLSILASTDAGQSWFGLAEFLPNTGNYLWETSHFANSANYRIIVKAEDDSLFSADTTALFTVNNPRGTVSDSLIQHTRGIGSGTVQVKIFNQSEISNHVYHLIFNDTLNNYTFYDVIDLNEDSLVVDEGIQLDGVTEGPPFSGVRLIVYDYPLAMVDQDNTGWLIGETNLTHKVTQANVIIGPDHLSGYPYASDYSIKLFNTVEDTSSTYLDAPAMPMKFRVFNRTENRQVDILFIDTNGDQSISHADEIYILENDDLGNPMLTWYIYFSGYDPIVLPQTDDEFVLKTFKPFTTDDVFEFNLSTVGIGDSPTSKSLNKFQLSQNYPNPFNPSTTISYRLSAISHVELTLYNMLGQKVRTLVSDKQNQGNYSIKLDANDLASGVYFYRLKAGKFVKTKKMILIH